ncbi:MAG TPA: alpha-galactosidase [Treponema sp.]|nr:alpha-galactosidase [Treponema sp.]
MYSKNDAAPFPPMGWNSYDYYNTMVNETQVRGNADYMARNLKQYGWEYIVIDIQWSDPDAGTDNGHYQYIPFSTFCLDEWSRQIPAPNRFPSSAGGKGFAPLADYVHSLGLKFGIHIMRGIPRYAAHNHLAVKTHDGSRVTADKIANPYSVSKWNPDMYGVDWTKEGAQDYYDSVFELYASWGVDFVKVDDICNTNMYPQNPYSAEKEIEMISHAIEASGRAMVLSLSPGPAVIEKAWHLEKYANMWRITDDFWDEWRFLKAMFERCEVWQKHTGSGSWPDCDMLPVGKLGYGFGHGAWNTRFTKDEQYTMLTLWCIFRAPLMIGADLPQLDDFTTSLLTNAEVLALEKRRSQAYLARKTDDVQIWLADADDGGTYAAVFNLGDAPLTISGSMPGISGGARDLWRHRELGAVSGLNIRLAPHAPLLLFVKA